MFTKENEPLKNHTTFRVGGNAKIFSEPENENEFLELVKNLKSKGEKFFILGGGSNLVFSDSGFNGTVISTSHLNGNEIVSENSAGGNSVSEKEISGGVRTDKSGEIFVRCGAGASISSVINFVKENCISGFEQFSGLPGTVGGAVYMNARCFEKSISDILESVEYFDLEKLEKCEYKFNAADWNYKKSPFQSEEKVGTKLAITNSFKIILSATFRLKAEIPNEEIKQRIATECRHYNEERISKGHFKFPSAGSVFKNNHEFGKPSGKIIDEAGLKGYKIGGAQIAPFHGNFIINTGTANAEDIKRLVEFAKKTVAEKFGFILEEEIIFVAE